MSSVRVIFDYKIEVLKGEYEGRIIVLQVPKSDKFIDGIKVRCILLDLKMKIPRLLLDNHEPFGYHLHTKLPQDKNYRTHVDIKNYEDAINLFLAEARKLVKNEIQK